MSYYKRIVGQRIYLSPFDSEVPEMAETWAEWMNDTTTAETYGGGGNILFTRESAKKQIESLSGYRFSIVLLDGDRLIGHTSLHNADTLHRNAFFGIVIGTVEDRNKGYGREALSLLSEYGFKTLNLHSIALTVHSDNGMAISCYKKVGFKEVGRLKEWVFKNGRYVDKLYMSILDSDFMKKI
ncbi:MAG: GNAT family N-acetyltransferase [Lachnospiraceae bacterium]|nr:GNAT family N-acetyltransferase [Lachnospiraceae bacterium]